MNKITIILMITLFYLNVVDACSTMILLTRTDMIETNPIMAFMFVNGLITAIIFKLALSGVMIIAFYEILKKVDEQHKQEAKTVTIVANIALLASVIFLTVTVINNVILIVR